MAPESGPGPLSENQLDLSYLEGNWGAHTVYTGWTDGSRGGAVSTSTGAGYVGAHANFQKCLKIYFPTGLTKESGSVSLMRFVGPPENLKPGQIWHLTKVRGAGSVRLRFRAGISGSASGWPGFQVSARAYFTDASGNYIGSATSPSVSVSPTHVTTEGAVFEVTEAVPPNAEYAYINLIVFTSETGSIQSSLALYLTDLYFGRAEARSGVTEISAVTSARQGLVAELSVRSKEKIPITLALPDRIIGGERVELAAAAHGSSDLVWHWRQILGPEVELTYQENAASFIAPDVHEPTEVRIGVYASSANGRNRSDWHFYDLTVNPPIARFLTPNTVTYEAVTPRVYGYERGKREIWNDVIPPPHMDPDKPIMHELIDIGVEPEDVQMDEEFPNAAPAGGIFVDLATGDVYRNFGEGYNDDESGVGSPRKDSYWVDPASGNVYKWMEEQDAW